MNRLRLSQWFKVNRELNEIKSGRVEILRRLETIEKNGEIHKISKRLDSGLVTATDKLKKRVRLEHPYVEGINFLFSNNTGDLLDYWVMEDKIDLHTEVSEEVEEMSKGLDLEKNHAVVDTRSSEQSHKDMTNKKTIRKEKDQQFIDEVSLEEWSEIRDVLDQMFDSASYIASRVPKSQWNHNTIIGNIEKLRDKLDRRLSEEHDLEKRKEEGVKLYG